VFRDETLMTGGLTGLTVMFLEAKSGTGFLVAVEQQTASMVVAALLCSSVRSEQ
jgi:hypothetical protein